MKINKTSGVLILIFAVFCTSCSQANYKSSHRYHYHPVQKWHDGVKIYQY